MPSVWPSASRAATSVEVNWPIANSVWSISRRWFDTAAASEDETALSCARLRLTVGTVSPNRPSAYAPAASAAPCTDPSKDVPAWDTARARSPACLFAASRASSVACASAARWSSASATATSGSLAASPSGSAGAAWRTWAASALLSSAAARPCAMVAPMPACASPAAAVMLPTAPFAFEDASDTVRIVLFTAGIAAEESSAASPCSWEVRFAMAARASPAAAMSSRARPSASLEPAALA